MRIFGLLAISLVLFGVFLFSKSYLLSLEEDLSSPQARGGQILTIRDIELAIAVAATAEQRARGLSNREKLAENQGMLFVFEKPDYYPFWMKDMLFAIDIIWIDEHKKIVDVTYNATPESYPQTFKPRVPVQYVLEVNAGWAETAAISIGEFVEVSME